jgi:hypothetical protein
VTHIHIGRFDRFKWGANTILLEVDAVGLSALIALVRSLADGSQQRAEFHRLPVATAHGGVTLVGEVTPHDLGLREVQHGEWIWRLSKTGWELRADWLSGLEGSESGHQYLEGPESGHRYLKTPTDPVQMIVSTGEYPEDWWWSVFDGPSDKTPAAKA